MTQERKLLLKRFAAACSYASVRGLAHTKEVAEEVRRMIPEVPCTAVSIEAVIETSRLDLIKEYERVHGPDCWRCLELGTAGVLPRMEALPLTPALRRYAYLNALASRPRLMGSSYDMMVATACTSSSKTLFQLIMENYPPNPHQLVTMLLDQRVMTSSAFMGCADIMEPILRSADLEGINLADTTLSLMTRGSTRGILIFAKLGHARKTPTQYGLSKVMLGIDKRLESNHGRLALMSDLPDLRELIKMGNSKLHTKVLNTL
jgi:hypothetical protein